MIIELEARVPVTCHVIHASVAEPSGTPYMLPVLEHVRESGGAATAASLSGDLFIPPPLCRSLLAYCAENGLAEDAGDGRHALTSDGSSALESGRVLTSTEGMWKVYVADHEAIPDGMRVVRIEDGADDAERQLGKTNQPSVRKTGAPMRDLQGKVLHPALGRMKEAIVRDVHRYEKTIEADLDIRLRVRPGKTDASVSLLASRVGDRKHDWHPPVPDEASLPSIDVTIDGVMDALLSGGRDGAWDAERERILVDCDSASDEEMTRMKKTVHVERPEVNGMGFKPVRVAAKIFPRSEADARRWARRLFAATADGYVTREEYARLVGGIEGRFTGFDICMGDRLGHVPGGGGTPGTRGRPRLFWLIQAMEDWDL